MLNELFELEAKASDLIERWQQSRKSRRQQIAEYFIKIEKCLQDSADLLKQNQVPNKQWGALETYAVDLSETIGQEIGKEQAKVLTRLLMRTAYNTPNDKDVNDLEAAAGKFQGLANSILAKQNVENPIRRKILTYTVTGSVGLATGYFIHKILPKNEPKIEPDRTLINSNNFWPVRQWKMHTVFDSSIEGTLLYNIPEKICELVKKRTKDKFNIELERNGETIDILKRVNDGTYECGYSGVYYDDNFKALYFTSAIPFGLTPEEQNIWLYYKKHHSDEETYVQSIYKKVGLKNIIAFPAGTTGAQMGGWFKQEIESLNDFKNLTMRIPGLGGEILSKKFGFTTHKDLRKTGKEHYPINKCIDLLRDGSFHAVEWTGPRDDIALGLHKAADFYYYPGWWEPSTTFDTQVNRSAWNDLPIEYQEIFRSVCFEVYMESLNRYNQENVLAMQNLPANVKLRKFDDEIISKAKLSASEVLTELSKDKIFDEVYTEWKNFRSRLKWIHNIT